MSHATHTPGPWKLERCQCGDVNCERYGTSNGIFYQGSGYTEADARLIAEAPAMLAALRQALPLIDAHRRAALGEGDIAAHNIRAILARIEGAGA